MMRLLRILILIVIIGFLSWGLFNLEKQSRNLEVKINSLKIDAEALNKENQKLIDDIEYYKFTENLLKEAKSLFNYHQPQEKLLFIIPDNNTGNENH